MDLDKGDEKKVTPSPTADKVTEPCPDCGMQLVHQEGIIECLNCGYQGPSCC